MKDSPIARLLKKHKVKKGQALRCSTDKETGKEHYTVVDAKDFLRWWEEGTFPIPSDAIVVRASSRHKLR